MRNPLTLALEETLDEKEREAASAPNDPAIEARMQGYESALEGYPPLVCRMLLHHLRDEIRPGGELDAAAPTDPRWVLAGFAFSIFYAAAHAGADGLCRRALFEVLLSESLPARLARRYGVPRRDVEAALLTAALMVVEREIGRGRRVRDRLALFEVSVRNQAVRLLKSDEGLRVKRAPAAEGAGEETQEVPVTVVPLEDPTAAGAVDAEIELLSEQEADREQKARRVEAILEVSTAAQRKLLDAFLDLAREGEEGLEPTWEAAAERCGIAPGTAASQLYRLRARIRTRL